MRTVYQTLYSQAGNQLEVLDYKLLQQELEQLETRALTNTGITTKLDERVHKLENIVLSLEKLVSFCCTKHPEVVNEFLVTERAKIRLETGG